MPNCVRCGKPLSFIQQYGLWYCFTCQQYFQPVQQPPQQIQPTPYYYQQTTPPQHIPPSEKSILPIIAVVVVVLIIIAVAAVFFMSLLADEVIIDSRGTTPTVSMYWTEDPEEPGNYVGYVVSISGISSLNIDDVTVTVSNGRSSSSEYLDILAGGDSLVVGDLTFTFTDSNNNHKLGAEDIFTITGGSSGDIIRLIYTPTSGYMCSTTLT